MLAINTMNKRGALKAIGNQIGVGKESGAYFVEQQLLLEIGLMASSLSVFTDVFIATDGENNYALKLHRLGRTSFRTVKNNRDYLQRRSSASWLYMSRLAALKEFAYMKILHENGFPVPKPIDVSRHCILMEHVKNSTLLLHIHELKNPEKVYNQLMSILVDLASAGLIHGDFNEFNLLINDDTEEVTMIDFPQMVSTDHLNADMYFQRDVDCIRHFFSKRFGFVSEDYPTLAKDVIRTSSLDRDVAASGFSKEMDVELLKGIQESKDDEEAEEDSEEEDEEEEEEEEEDLEEEDEEEEEEEREEEEDAAQRRSKKHTLPPKQKGKKPVKMEVIQGIEVDEVKLLPEPATSATVETTNNTEAPEQQQASASPDLVTGKLPPLNHDDFVDSDDDGELGNSEGSSRREPRDPRDKRVIAQRVKAQLAKKREKQKVNARNSYKNREKRRLNGETRAWAAEFK
jgi:RIO kinase 2